ncbi:uncharacterized protein LOC117333843 [Pecten maximus]|uniref:uncharacterized protein LOC117333843 n=1 Tax=Pecten maximus TaxID=6579 RepID=UPI001458A4C7|nr:uncharacterized protein LOC117333843 [Pecten maximus]
MQISGHKNLQSVNSYSTINCSQQRTISRVLSNSSMTSSQQPAVTRPTVNFLSSCSSGSMTKTGTGFNATPFLFGGPIYGGTFNVTINNATPAITPRKRCRAIDSASDSD